MSRKFVLTLTGPDRVGIVEEVTRAVFDRGGNVEASRMARLGGEFAVLLLAAFPEGKGGDLGGDLADLADRGFKVAITPADSDANPHVGWIPYRIVVDGADDEGIIHQIASRLARHGVSIEEMDSESTLAPTSGAPLFAMTALVLAPPDADPSWIAELEEVGWTMNLEVDVAPADEDEFDADPTA